MTLHRPIAAVAVVCALVALGPATTAQQPPLPHPLILDHDAARDLIESIRSGLPYVRGELLVKFRAGSNQTGRERALSTIRGGVTGARTRWVGDALLVGTPGEPDAELAAQMLARQPEIEWAQPNYLRRRRLLPNDSQYSAQWHLPAIQMPAAWDINPGASASVTVAIIDSGLTSATETLPFDIWTGSRFETVPFAFAANPDLASTRVTGGRDFVFWTGPVLDMDGHGSHVAGTALQDTNNNLGTAGIAYGARVMPLKVCIGYWELLIIQAVLDEPGFPEPTAGACPDSAVAAALRFAADSGAQVANISIGGPGEAPALLQALQYAVQRGTFVSLPSGNGFEDGNEAEYPAAYASQVDGAVEVGATGRSQRRASYSTTGTHVELAAPGGDPFDGGSAGFIYQTAPALSDFSPFTVLRPRFDRYAVIGASGTSSAAPHAAGVAALLRAQGVTSPAAIEALLKLTAADLGTAGRDNEFGFGLIDARAALRGMGLRK